MTLFSLYLASLCMWLYARHVFCFYFSDGCSMFSINHSFMTFYQSPQTQRIWFQDLGWARPGHPPRDSHKASGLIGFGAPGTAAGFWKYLGPFSGMTGHIQITVPFLELTGSSSTLEKAGTSPPPKNPPEVNGAGIPGFPTETERKRECVFKYHSWVAWVLILLPWVLLLCFPIHWMNKMPTEGTWH